MLDINSPSFGAELRAAIGAGADEPIAFTTPQFTREDGKVVPAPDKNINWGELPKKAEKELLDLGLRPWDDNEKGTLWLYPGEWYSSIPKGHPIVDISGEEELFEPGRTDDDIRYGCLAYGFIRSVA
jgi:hypothetical protein